MNEGVRRIASALKVLALCVGGFGLVLALFGQTSNDQIGGLLIGAAGALVLWGIGWIIEGFNKGGTRTE